MQFDSLLFRGSIVVVQRTWRACNLPRDKACIRGSIHVPKTAVWARVNRESPRSEAHVEADQAWAIWTARAPVFSQARCGEHHDEH